MCHDAMDYPNPDLFDPDRFLTEDGRINPEIRDPSTIVFGFGRRYVFLFCDNFVLSYLVRTCRICAGRHFAKEAIFPTIASILSVFNIQPAVDEDGHPIRISTSAAAPGGGLFLSV